ncbi:MAG: peptidylprolyl isomerase [Burkholderiales bacterium]|nr:peptidylprolyl isomerase [Burkholderiales bacterium]
MKLKLHFAISLVAALANVAHAQVLAKQGDLTVTASDVRAAIIGYDDKSETAKFSSLTVAKDSISALLLTKQFVRGGDALLRLTDREKVFLNYAADRNRLDAALALLDRRERERAKSDQAAIEARAKEFYDARPDGFKVPAKAKVAHILLRPDGKRSISELAALAEKISKLGREGTPWQLLVDTYTDDAKSREKAGEVGDFYENNSDHPMVVGAFRSSLVNEISEPVLSRSGIHVVKVIKREPTRRGTYEEVKEKLIDAVIQERITTARQDFISSLEKTAPTTFDEGAIAPFIAQSNKFNDEQMRRALNAANASDFAPPAPEAKPADNNRGGATRPK